MARRTASFFNLSFLDVLSGALGAILFLFIVVDKSGGQEGPPPARGNFRKAYLSLDTAFRQLHGLLPDTLSNLKPGESLLVVVDAIKPAPQQPECPPQRPCPTCTNTPCPDPSAHRRKQPETPAEKTPATFVKCPDPSHHEKALCDSPECIRGERTVYKGDPIALAYKLGFSLTAASEQDEIDLQICREGGACVFGGNTKGEGMRWLNLKDGLLFGKARAWNEIIVAEKTFEPGVYTCYARLSCKSASNSNVELVAATKKGNLPAETVTLRKSISCGNEWIEIGKVQVGANYTISKK